MNTDSRNDPMLSSFINDDWGKLAMVSSTTDSLNPSLNITQSTSSTFSIPTDNLLSPESNSLSEFVTIWPSERKRVLSIKIDDDDAFSASSYSISEDVDKGGIDMEEMDVGSHTTVIKIEPQDCEYDDTSKISLSECTRKRNNLHMTEAEARRFVEREFEKIAFLPSSKLGQREKIEYILAKSDCTDFSIESVLNFDKRSLDSARACARIVQNIPQRYRWECVMPEDIPCCYTIVADCKKVSSRDKPPRPMNAFMIWAQGARRLINELCPKMQNALISEALGYYWRQKSDAFKKSFEQEKIKLRQFHNVEFPEYKYKPKTKVQKAKEKQEQCQIKAKRRASVRRDKLPLAEDSISCHRRTKSGRPRKAKPTSSRKEQNKPTHSVMSEQSDAVSARKPAIKDMLTLKILNDRKSKRASSDNSKTKSNLRETVHSAFGQLSPLEIGSPYMGDIFDDMGSLNITLVDHIRVDKDVNSKVMSSSVYDTPANTPPVDIDDEIHLSPLQPHPVSLSSVSTSTTTSVTSSEPRVEDPSSSSVSAADKITQKPSLSAVLLPSNKMLSSARNGHRLPTRDVVKPVILTTTSQSPSVSSNQILDISDMLFTYVTEALSSAHQKSASQGTKFTTVTDSRNNNSVQDNNNLSDSNNNTIDILPSYASAVFNSSKHVTFCNESSDLDALHLDLSGPILSDDDMRCLLNTL